MFPVMLYTGTLTLMNSIAPLHPTFKAEIDVRVNRDHAAIEQHRKGNEEGEKALVRQPTARQRKGADQRHGHVDEGSHRRVDEGVLVADPHAVILKYLLVTHHAQIDRPEHHLAGADSIIFSFSRLRLAHSALCLSCSSEMSFCMFSSAPALSSGLIEILSY